MIESNGVELQDVTLRVHVIGIKQVGGDAAPSPGAGAMVDSLQKLLQQKYCSLL